MYIFLNIFFAAIWPFVAFCTQIYILHEGEKNEDVRLMKSQYQEDFYLFIYISR